MTAPVIEERYRSPRPVYYRPMVCEVNARLDGECAAYFALRGDADKAYEFALSAARWARWSTE